MKFIAAILAAVAAAKDSSLSLNTVSITAGAVTATSGVKWQGTWSKTGTSLGGQTIVDIQTTTQTTTVSTALGDSDYVWSFACVAEES